MALIIADRVQEATPTTGTSSYTLTGAEIGFQSFGAVMANGDTTYYAVTDNIDWEVGVGTYSTTGPTMARTTILASSNGGAAVNWSTVNKSIFLSYAAGRSVYLDVAGDLPVADKIVHTGDTDTAIRFPAANTMSVETGGVERFKVENSTITTTVPIALPANPTLALQATTKQYVDALIASGIHFHAPVRVESPTALTATYNNGASGVGATLTNAGTQVALVIDGVTVATNDRVLIYQQANQTQNGIYVVTNTGSGSTNWVLTRASDADTYVINNANGLSEGSTVFVLQGTTGAGETYTCNTSGTITFGTTNITFVQISTAQIYSAGSGLTLTGTVFAHADTSSQASVDNSGAVFIQDVGLDTFGHVTGLASTTVTPVLIGAAPADSPVFTGVASFPDGSAAAPSITNTGDTNTGIFFPAADTIAFTEGGVESMRITSAGNVGIGTASPASALDVLGGIRSTSVGGNSQIITTSIGDTTFANNGVNWLTVKNGAPADSMRIDASGNVGIGTTSPTADLTIGGSVPRLDFLETGGSAGFDNTTLIRDADVFAIQTRNVGTFVSNDYRMTTNASGALTHEWRIANTERMRINASGNVGIGTASPTTALDVNGVASAVFFENPQTITASYTIASGKNAMSVGPVTVDAGATITVSAGARYVVI